MSSTPPLHRDPDLRGKLLGGRYRLEEILAYGGSASVYEGYDLRLKRPVAIKVPYSEYVRTPLQRRRIIQEATLGARVHHPHVLPIFDIDQLPGAGNETRVYMVMPRISGVTLRRVVSHGPLPWRRAIRLATQLAEGLAALHDAGVLHRDIKPENCMVTCIDGRDHLRLGDFGLAKTTITELLSQAPESIPGVIIGSLPYISPEQTQGLALDLRSDIYSVAVVLFEMLTGRTPFADRTNPIAQITAQITARPPSPRRLVPGSEIPPAVEAVVLQALSKDPRRRHSSSEWFAAAINIAAQTVPGPPEDPIRGLIPDEDLGLPPEFEPEPELLPDPPTQHPSRPTHTQPNSATTPPKKTLPRADSTPVLEAVSTSRTSLDRETVPVTESTPRLENRSTNQTPAAESTPTTETQATNTPPSANNSTPTGKNQPTPETKATEPPEPTTETEAILTPEAVSSALDDGLATVTGSRAALASLAAWTRFDYDIARREARRATDLDHGWSPLYLLMSCLPDED
ncbi:MAG TPA: serine/threonine protein kinase [Nannocystis exedens]|nr:serine/threonine protein kinase [Nannocystis exedens]